MITDGDLNSESGDYAVYVPERSIKNLLEVQQSNKKAREMVSRRSISQPRSILRNKFGGKSEEYSNPY